MCGFHNHRMWSKVGSKYCLPLQKKEGKFFMCCLTNYFNMTIDLLAMGTTGHSLQLFSKHIHSIRNITVRLLMARTGKGYKI